MIRGLARLALAALAVAAFVTPAFAGNIALTGHDDDFHCSGAVGANCTQTQQMLAFVRSGSTTPTLKVLSFDMGSQLTSDLTAAGITFDNISSPLSVTAALFDPTIYSAFIVASDSTCGGCDNSTAMTAALVAQKPAINSFFNAGGGIAALTGGSNAATYYSFLPVTAAGAGSPPSTGYAAPATPCFGTPITPVNGDPTHNFFPEPGTAGLSSLFCVAERNTLVTGLSATTVLLQGGTIVTDVITTGGGGAVPEPASLTLLGLGLVGAAYRRRRKA